MLATLTRGMNDSRCVRRLDRMKRVIRLHAIHPRSMGCADRRNHGDREYDKHGEDTGEHA
ncbi:hypothetical protein [Ponticoccus litoralis]|uniref:Uncharacterized protein n=1 Tax=Ponticoccus litoralis TaxID=422297 RepID=A0AAW9SP91_9RHOB